MHWKNGRIAGAGFDVYEEELHLFFEDYFTIIVNNDIILLLVSLPNVIITYHQGFLTDEALKNIAEITVENLNDFFAGRPLEINSRIWYNIQKNSGSECILWAVLFLNS